MVEFDPNLPNLPYPMAAKTLDELLGSYQELFGHDVHTRTNGDTEVWFRDDGRPTVELGVFPGAVFEVSSVGKVRLDEVGGDDPNAQDFDFITVFGNLTMDGVPVTFSEEGPRPNELDGAEYEALFSPEHPPVMVRATELEDGDTNASTRKWLAAQKFELGQDDSAILFGTIMAAKDDIKEQD